MHALAISGISSSVRDLLLPHHAAEAFVEPMCSAYDRVHNI